MKNIRQNVFETNSSSTHSICIAKNVELDIPKEIYFQFGEFGWEEDRLNSMSEKASYLYTAIKYNSFDGAMDKIIETLKRNGVEKIELEESDENDTWGGGYIDHGGQLCDFIDEILDDEEFLLNYLFSPLSFVLTGNDNSGTDVSINVKYDHDEFYKGN